MKSFKDIRQEAARKPAARPPGPRPFTCRMTALALGAAAALVALSVGGALFGDPAEAGFLGALLADSYGAIAFAIPAYLAFAAAILFDKTFRPGRIFVLNCAIFPFITLAVGFSFLRDFDAFGERVALLRFLGKSGFGFFMIFLTVMECAAIAAFTAWLFPPFAARRTARAADAPRYAGPDAGANEIKIIRVPIVKGEPDGAADAEAEPDAGPAEPPPLFRALEAAPYAPPAGTRPKAALDEAYRKARAEAEAAGDRNVDAALENLNERLRFIDELPAYPSVADGDAPPEPAADEPAEAETAPDDDTAEAEIAPDEPLEAETAPDEAGPFERPEDEPSGDLEKLIMKAEHEAAQKTEEFMRRQAATEGARENRLLPPAQAAFKKKTPRYAVPVDGLLNDYGDDQYWLIDDAAKKSALILKQTLNEFNIQAEVTGIRKGPVITMFEILPSPGVKLSKIVNLQDNIALRLAASPVRIVAPIPGKHAVGIEVPNRRRSIVSFKEIIGAQIAKGETERKKWALPVVLGKDISGEAVTVDLAAMPHLLIAGATGSGKSVCVNTMILSILYQCTPADCRLILIDPKIVELKLYNDIPHLLTPVITEPRRAFQALQYCIYEMERRYVCLDGMGARDIKTYNKRIKERDVAAEPLPRVVVIIDEFADLMATTGKELESAVARLAAMSRAVGIHIVLATQRPSIDVITGLIKSNIPSRIAFMVAGMMDSRIIIDTGGAEKLLGKGDMLYSGITDPFPVRMQGAFVSEEEVERVVEHVKTLGEPDYIDDEIFLDEDEEVADLYADGDDPLYDKALELVSQQGKASASYLQRRLKIGYNRAARLVEEMEHRGLVGPAQGSRPRDLLRAV